MGGDIHLYDARSGAVVLRLEFVSVSAQRDRLGLGRPRPHPITLAAAALVLSVPMSTCNYPCAPIDPSCPKEHATVGTGGATVSGTTATLTGDVNPNGSPTTAWFEWSTSSNLGNLSLTPAQAVGSGTTVVPITAGLTGLSPGTTYYYQAVASNSAGRSPGGILSFTTP